MNKNFFILIFQQSLLLFIHLIVHLLNFQVLIIILNQVLALKHQYLQALYFRFPLTLTTSHQYQLYFHHLLNFNFLLLLPILAIYVPLPNILPDFSPIPSLLISTIPTAIRFPIIYLNFPWVHFPRLHPIFIPLLIIHFLISKLMGRYLIILITLHYLRNHLSM